MCNLLFLFRDTAYWKVLLRYHSLAAIKEEFALPIILNDLTKKSNGAYFWCGFYPMREHVYG